MAPSAHLSPTRPVTARSTCPSWTSTAIAIWTCSSSTADGTTDIAVANNLSSDLSVLLGKGDGTFWQPPRSYRTGAAPFAVTAVSFAPQDPRPGLVTANNLANTISIFLAKDPRSNLVPRN